MFKRNFYFKDLFMTKQQTNIRSARVFIDISLVLFCTQYQKEIDDFIRTRIACEAC